VRHRASLSYAEVRARCEATPALLAKGPGFVLYALMDFIVDNYFPIVDALEDELERLEDEIFAKKTVDQLNSERPLVEAYFDYDKFDIRDDQRGTLQKNADYLRRWPSVRVSIEGHADERGTSEYNLALGERRANAVMQYLGGLGIATTRFVVVSKGKEQPVCREMTEECHARNRRGLFIITAK